MMDKKYGKFSLGVPLGLSFGSLRGFAPVEADGDADPDALFDGTGIIPDEHDETERATPTAIAATSTRRMKILNCLLIAGWVTQPK
jgi:hypothetical protein